MNSFLCVTERGFTFTYQTYGAIDRTLKSLKALELHKAHPGTNAIGSMEAAMRKVGLVPMMVA